MNGAANIGNVANRIAMAIMAAGDLYVGEQVDHTIRFSLMRPVGKAKLFFSKAAADWVLCAYELAEL